MTLIAIESTPDHAADASAEASSGPGVVSGVLGLVLGIVSLYCAFRTWKKGHKVLFVIGLFMPLAWIVGALMKPREARLA